MRTILSLLLAFFALTGSAQIRGNEITVTVTPDHKDWTYAAGEKSQLHRQRTPQRNACRQC